MIAASKHESGFTLIEVLIAVALFALIGLAGFTLVETIIGVQIRTADRLERLGEIQRTMHILTLDFDQATAGSVTFDGARVQLRRPAGNGLGAVSIGFALKDGNFVRTIGAAPSGLREQILLGSIEKIAWQFFLPSAGWQDTPASKINAKEVPQVVAIDVTFDGKHGVRGTLRRLIALPSAVHP